jgi:hypothetical protein
MGKKYGPHKDEARKALYRHGIPHHLEVRRQAE